MNPVPDEITANLARVQERIERAALRAGRNPAEITLVAVSKTHPAQKIRELYEAGVRHFGENRVQEREAKSAQLEDLDINWHMIGHLQKNKVGRAAELFDSIDSIDSLALADKIDRAWRAGFNEEPAPGAGRDARQAGSGLHALKLRLRALMEVKLDPEPAKSGVDGRELPRLLDAAMQLPHLDVAGLMGIPPYFDNPEESRPYFRRLRELRDSLAAGLPTARLPVLSMGMSHDFEVAIEEGATEIRVGTALFGERARA